MDNGVKIQQQGPENQAQSNNWTALGTPPTGNGKTQKMEEKARAKQLVSKSTDYIDFLPYRSLMTSLIQDNIKIILLSCRVAD